MSSFKNPNFQPSDENLTTLHNRKRSQFDSSFPGSFPAHKVKKVTERIAEQAVEALLCQLPKNIPWINANTLRRNQKVTIT
jgi:hypothetical protein